MHGNVKRALHARAREGAGRRHGNAQTCNRDAAARPRNSHTTAQRRGRICAARPHDCGTTPN
eukprot:5393452-Lingulodinium_polyedra.AAC.1